MTKILGTANRQIAVDDTVYDIDLIPPNTPIDTDDIDKQIESDLLDMWLLWERGNWYLNDDHPNYDKEHDRRFRDAIVEYITKLIANQVREARIEMYNLYGEPRCSQLHHPKKDQHPFLEDCPVVNRIKELGE